MRAATSGSGWHAWSGTLTRVEGGVAFHVYEFAGQAWFMAKPVAWDEILWRVAGANNPAKRSISFHFRGLSVRVPALETVVLRARESEELATQIVAFAERMFDDFDPGFEFDVSELIRRDVAGKRADDFVITEVIWHLAQGRRAQALHIADEVIAGRRRSTFNMNTENGSVFELVQRAISNDQV